MLKRGAIVFMQAHSQYRGLLVGVARRLRGDLDAAVHLYCANAQEVAHYTRIDPDGTLFAAITADNHLYPNAEKPVVDAGAVIDTARANESWLGLSMNTLALADRHLGRGYALGGFNHPRSRRSELTSYEQMLQGFNAQIAFWRGEFEKHRPVLVINGGWVPAKIARRLGVSFRTLSGSRYKNLHQWAHNEYFENPAVEDAYRALDRNSGVAAEIEAPYDSHVTLRGKSVAASSTLGLLRGLADRVLRHAWWNLRGYEKAKGYYMTDEMRYLILRWRDRRLLEKRATLRLADLSNKTFVYYPLHMEPEVALQGMSPEYFFQLGCIAAVSRDLPAGTVLVVKETLAALGRRPADFYDQIRAFKNVVMIDPLEFGLDVVRQCAAVVTITGTGGFEGAVMGKPVISFGRHNQYNILPHVSVVTDETMLAAYLRAALDDDADHAAWRRDGARFLDAVKAMSFDLEGFDVLDAATVEDAVVDRTYAALCDSLGESLVAATL